MTKAKTFRVVILIAAALASSSCGVFKKGKGTRTPVLGNRVAVLTGEGDVTVDPDTTALPMSLPDPVANTDWAQSGGDADHSMGQAALAKLARPGIHGPGRPRQHDDRTAGECADRCRRPGLRH